MIATTGIVLLLVVSLTWPTLQALHGRWLDGAAATYTHGYLIAAVSLYMLWRQRAALAVLRPAASPAGLGALLISSLVWMVGLQSSLQIMEFAAWPLLLLAAVLAFLGPLVAARCAFALLFLYFAMPVWAGVTEVLQWGTVFAVRAALRLAGIPAFFSADLVQLPSGVFEIADGCGGVHFFMVALALGALLGELRADGWKRRLQLLALAGLLSILTNWLRVFAIIVVGHRTHMQHYLVAESHYGFGWVLFGFAMLLFFLLERRMAIIPDPMLSVRMFAPLAGRTSSSMPLVVSGLVFLLVPQVLMRLADRPAPPAAIVQLPAAPGGILGPTQPVTGWMPRMQGADAEFLGSYQAPGHGRVDLYLATYLSQHQGKELAAFGNDLGDADNHVYLVDRRQFQRPAVAQLYYAWRSLSGLRAAASHVIAVRMRCEAPCAGDTEALKLIFNLAVAKAGTT